MDIELQLENISLEDEFMVEIGSPSSYITSWYIIEPKQNKTKNGYILEELYPNFDDNIVNIHKMMRQREFFMKKDVWLN